MSKNPHGYLDSRQPAFDAGKTGHPRPGQNTRDTQHLNGTHHKNTAKAQIQQHSQLVQLIKGKEVHQHSSSFGPKRGHGGKQMKEVKLGKETTSTTTKLSKIVDEKLYSQIGAKPPGAKS